MEYLVQGISLAGAGMILTAYTLLQMGWLPRDAVAFNLLNLVGSVLLTVVAVIDGRWGFILLEAVWAVLSLVGLLRPRRVGRPA